MAGSQALNAQDAVTVAEPKWPPPIQNAAAAVVPGGDYANVQRTVGFHLKHPRRLRLKAATGSEETTGGLQKGRAEKTQQDDRAPEQGKRPFLVITILHQVKYQVQRGNRVQILSLAPAL